MKFYHPPWNYHTPRKWMVGRCWKTLLSFWDAIFSGPMLVSGRATFMGPLGANYTPLLPWSMIEAAWNFQKKHAAHTTTLSKPHLELLICPAIGWRLIHLPKSQQMNILWHPWGHLDLRNCCHRTVYFIELNTVRRQQFRRSRWAQGCKADSGHRLFIYYPKWRLIHLPKSQLAANAPCVSMCGLNLLHIPYPRSRRIHLPRSQQMRAAWLSPPKPALYPRWRRIHLQEYAVQPWADLEPQNCHRQSLHYPRSRRIHLPKLQQMRAAWPESPVHELILNRRTVAAKFCTTPGDDCGISMRPRGKSLFCCCNLWLNYQSCNALSVLYLCFF